MQLKPQDLVVALKAAVHPGAGWTFAASPEPLQDLLGEVTSPIRWRRAAEPCMHVVVDGPPVELDDLIILTA